jgi:multiple sugar transport system ATP-binding protein
MARRAGVFLLDEPLSNLDAALRLQARTELARLRRSIEATLLYVTHDREEAMTLADRIAVLKDGRIEQIGAPLEIYERPATAFVGGFLGSPPMSFIRGVLRDGGARFEAPGISIDLERAARASSADSEVLLGIRPEHIDLVPRERGGVAARVDLVAPLGKEVLLHVDVAAGEGSSSGEAPVRLALLADPSAAPVVGDRVGLRLRAERAHLFDPATQRRI